MTTLDAAPLGPLLTSLFREAETSEQMPLGISAAERKALMEDRTAYRDLYGRLREHWLPVSPETGRLLYLLARFGGARTIVEFGTSFGISTLHLAAALRDNGGGRLITTEFEPGKAARARAYFAQGGVADLVELREGDALETLAHDLPGCIDLLLLDGAKAIYADVLDLCEPRLRPGALVVADDADKAPVYLQRVRGCGYVSLPFGADVELSLRVG